MPKFNSETGRWPGDVRPFVVHDPDIRLEKARVYILKGTDYPYEPRDGT